MGYETKDVNDLLNSDSPVETLPGSFGKQGNSALLPKDAVFRVFIGCLNDDNMRLFYEELLTKSYKCQGVLKNPGDLALITMQNTFDKEGCFHVVARYAIIPEKKSNA